MSFPHSDYSKAINSVWKDARLNVQAHILDFSEDAKQKGLFKVRLRFKGRVDTTDFAEGGSARQYDNKYAIVFSSTIVTFDESTGEAVIEASQEMPRTQPDPARELVLNPPDFYEPLNDFAQEIGSAPEKNAEQRFVDLAASLTQAARRKENSACRKALRTSQNVAVDAATHNAFTFIWGPPGTGKSYTLGHLAAEWRKAGKKVLVLAHTNAAVDVATFAIDNACKDRGEVLADAELIRYTRKLSNISEYERRPHLLAFTRLLNRLLEKEACLREQKANLQQTYARLPADDEKRTAVSLEIAKLEACLKDIGATRKEELKQLLNGASIVCASITSSLFSSLLKDFAFDAIMLDEASLVPLAVWPWLLHPWHKERLPQIAVAGDPMQLQPILKSRDRNKYDRAVEGWFKTNIYAYLGIDSLEAARRLMDAGTLVFLDEQFRMARGIREAVSKTFYAGRLRGDLAKPLSEWPSAAKIPNGDIVLLDPERCAMPPSARRTPDINKANTNSKSIDVTLALVRRMVDHLRKNASRRLSILVVTPFRNQANEYEKRLTALPKPKNVQLRSTTIHRSQGSEADVVVFDLVDAGSWFLSAPDAAPRWCVACSRAKSQLFLIGSECGMRKGTFSGKIVAGLPVAGLP